ncbi:MaoC family dehydratase [Pseudomonadota bacterium 24LQ007]
MSLVPITDPNLQESLLGSCYTACKLMDDEAVRGFAEISGDTNPIHLDDDYASESRYKKRIAHGLLSASLFSGIFGTQFPGAGCVYAEQSLVFKRPVYIGDEVVATAELVSIDDSGQSLEFDTRCEVKGRRVLEGRAKVFIPKQR